MISITVVIFSIIVISLLALSVRKAAKINICPVCAGVSLTWVWMLIAKFANYQVDPVILPILIGGSVVGVMSLLEKRYPAGKSPIIWKMSFIPLGFVAAWALINFNWLLFFPAALAQAAITVGFFYGGVKETPRTAELEKKMENCC